MVVRVVQLNNRNPVTFKVYLYSCNEWSLKKHTVLTKHLHTDSVTKFDVVIEICNIVSKSLILDNSISSNLAREDEGKRVNPPYKPHTYYKIDFSLLFPPFCLRCLRKSRLRCPLIARASNILGRH